jgi:arylsulfatase
LGDAPSFLPTHHGFDDYFGLPYSNDMWPRHPTSGTNYPPLPLFEGEKVVEVMPDQTRLTARYTERAVNFIRANRQKPFLSLMFRTACRTSRFSFQTAFVEKPG